MLLERGYSLVEMSLALVVIGLLASAGWMALKPSVELTEQLKQQQFLNNVQEKIVLFAQNNTRLPCPDVTGDGWEDSCSANDDNVGALPTATLGLNERGAFFRSLLYGVYRGSGSLDLTQLAERTGDTPGDAGYQTITDLIFALDQLTGASIETGQIYVTGDGIDTGVINCTSNRVTNVAIALAAPGGRSMNGDSNLFDGVNASLNQDGTSTTPCFASPTQMKNASYDDQVTVISFNELKGKLVNVNNSMAN